jgi:hypothetical protein
LTRDKTLVPNPLLGLTNPPGESFADGVERMIATPIDFLAEEIAVCSAATGNPAGRDAERGPAHWLRWYVASLLRAWKGFGPVWHGTRPALDRETERVAMATAFDAQLELLDGLLDDEDGLREARVAGRIEPSGGAEGGAYGLVRVDRSRLGATRGRNAAELGG